MPGRLAAAFLTIALSSARILGSDEPSALEKPAIAWRWSSPPPSEEVITRHLESVAALGFGSIELLPDTSIPELPEETVRLLTFTGNEAARLGLLLELPVFPDSPAPLLPALRLEPFEADVTTKDTTLELPPLPLAAIGAWPPQGEGVDLGPFVDADAPRLLWNPPPGHWAVLGLFTAQLSGGSDPFSPAALNSRLQDQAITLAAYNGPLPHASVLTAAPIHHADWTPDFFDHFARLRGYDLRTRLPAMFGRGPAGESDRLACDFRETLSDLRVETLNAHHAWAHTQAALSHQRLAAPQGHPLDLHVAPDFPGIQAAELPEPADTPALSFAPSAAHLTTKPFVTASLSAPVSRPAQLQRAANSLFLAGFNRLLLDPAALPHPENSLPPDLVAFTASVARTQAFLQTGIPDPDVLLYVPAHDWWSQPGGLPAEPKARAAFLRNTSLLRTAAELIESGLTFDFVSDRLLNRASVIDGRIALGGLTYRTVIFPKVRRLPEATARHLLQLTRRGAHLTFLGGLPEDVPGIPSPEIRRGTLFRSLHEMPAGQVAADPSLPLADLLAPLEIQAEPMVRLGLHFTRRQDGSDFLYFIHNPTDTAVDAWTTLGRTFASATITRPTIHARRSNAQVRKTHQDHEILLRLQPHQSLLLRTSQDPSQTDSPRPEDHPAPISGTWTLHFLNADTPPIQSPLLGSWTTLGTADLATFTGTVRYEIDFQAPTSGTWLLDLGQVADTARVYLNGSRLGHTFAPPHLLDPSPQIKPGSNRLAVEVTAFPSRNPSSPAPQRGLLGPVRLVPAP